VAGVWLLMMSGMAAYPIPVPAPTIATPSLGIKMFTDAFDWGRQPDFVRKVRGRPSDPLRPFGR
jgi:hypothetical protein